MLTRLLDPVCVGLLFLLFSLAAWTWCQPRRTLLPYKISAWTGFVILWLGASPWSSNALVRTLQPPPTNLETALSESDPSSRTMIVLAGGSRNNYGHVPAVERLDDATHARLLGGARIYRKHGFSVVIVTGTGSAYVRSMADFLVLLGVPPNRIKLEIEATDTETNAIFAAKLLAEHKPKQVVLVTSALHMNRSVKAFAEAGVGVVPAPVDYIGARGWRLLPSSQTLHRTSRAMHELLGLFEP